MTPDPTERAAVASLLERLATLREDSRRQLRGLRAFEDRNRAEIARGRIMPEGERHVWLSAVLAVEDNAGVAARCAIDNDSLEVATAALGFACDLVDLRNVCASLAAALREGEAALKRAAAGEAVR